MNNTLISDLTPQQLLKKIEQFLKKNKVSYKFVDEDLIIYPDDYTNLDVTKINPNDTIYFSLLRLNYDLDTNLNDIVFDPYFEIEELGFNNDFIRLEDIFEVILNIKNISLKHLCVNVNSSINDDFATSDFLLSLKKLNLSEDAFLALLDKYNAYQAQLKS
jgi:hypothetical protein